MSSRTSNILLVALIALAAVICVALAFLVVIPRLDQPDPTPTPDPSDAWSRIEAKGVMVVGSSVDYPPFEYYDSAFKMDGLDIALINDLGRRLGVQVEIRDMAFDGLGSALQLNQIDTAIAAISTTDERRASIDFSNVYYVGDTGILGREGENIPITGVDDLARYRVGVQRGTVYEDWLVTNLINTGKMPVTNLFVYDLTDQMIRDLQQGLLQLVVLDRAVAETTGGNVNGVKVVALGLNPQRFAIALGQNQSALKERLNASLAEAQADGTLLRLTAQYLELDPGEITPPPTPGPQPTPVPTGSPPSCIDGMRFVADLTLDDDGMQNPPKMAPGQPFVKGWRLLNSGTCTWDSSYTMRYVGGNTPLSSMSGQPTAIQGIVPPGATYDMYVEMVAPSIPDVYQGFWSMFNGQDAQFGDRVWVGIEVVGSSTATPAATQTPATGIIFTVDRDRIQQGECVTFNWTTQNAKAVYFYRAGENWQYNQVPPQNSRMECPANSTSYFLRVVNTSNQVELREIPIYVTPTQAPIITLFVVNPPQITLGQCVRIQWQVDGNVGQITLSADNRVLWDNAPRSGTFDDCPGSQGTVEYRLDATGSGGTSRAQEYVNIVLPATATPAPTPAPELPQVDAFSVTPNQIQVGDCVNISWVTSGGTTLVQIKRDGVLILDNAPLSGSAPDCPSTQGVLNYSIEAYNNVNQVNSQSAQVSVSPGPPENPLANTNWTVSTLNGQSLLTGTQMTAQFDAGGRVNGTGGCNTYQASYVVNGSSIAINGLAGTQTLCSDPPGIMDQEAAYYAALQQASSYSLSSDGSLLTMTDANGREILRFSSLVATPLN